MTGLMPGTTYSVTVICVDANGKETSGGSTSELTTPPELSLLSAAATSSTTGTATADPDPTNAFVLVCGWPCAWGHSAAHASPDAAESLAVLSRPAALPPV